MAEKSKHITWPGRPKNVTTVDATIWTAVKRIENCIAEIPKLTADLRSEITELRKQVKKANAVIVKLIQDQSPTDFDTLKQHHHHYDRTSD